MISQAQAAVVEGLVSSEAFHEIMRSIQEDLFSTWCGETDQQRREQIYNELKGLETVWDKLQSLTFEIKNSGDTRE